MYAYLQVYASENNGRFVRHKNQLDALIQFTYMLVDAYGICIWRISINRIEIKPTVFMQQVLELK